MFDTTSILPFLNLWGVRRMINTGGHTSILVNLSINAWSSFLTSIVTWQESAGLIKKGQSKHVQAMSGWHLLLQLLLVRGWDGRASQGQATGPRRQQFPNKMAALFSAMHWLGPQSNQARQPTTGGRAVPCHLSFKLTETDVRTTCWPRHGDPLDPRDSSATSRDSLCHVPRGFRGLQYSLCCGLNGPDW